MINFSFFRSAFFLIDSAQVKTMKIWITVETKDKILAVLVKLDGSIAINSYRHKEIIILIKYKKPRKFLISKY